jgi:uncharacterized phage infection (PIP) family protein YhgE
MDDKHVTETAETSTTVNEVVDKIETPAEEVKSETVSTPEVPDENEGKDSNVEIVSKPSKKQTWWNRIWSAIVGAIVAVAAMLGITTEEVNEQKARVQKITVCVTEAKEALSKGDIASAKAKVEEAITISKEIAGDVKQVKENADKLIETVKTEVEKKAAEAAEKKADK